MFASTVNMDKWQFNMDKDKFIIYPKKLGLNQMEIRINFWECRGYLLLNPNIYDSVKVRQMIQNNPIFISLLKGFEYHDEWIIWNMPFNKDICPSSFDSSCYIWGHDTEHVANVLFETYIKPFMTDEIADFVVKVCEESKKQ